MRNLCLKNTSTSTELPENHAFQARAFVYGTFTCSTSGKARRLTRLLRVFRKLLSPTFIRRIAYYWDNKQEIDQQMKEADEFVEQFEAS